MYVNLPHQVKFRLATPRPFVYGIDKEKTVALWARNQQNISAVSSRVQPLFTFDDYNPRK
jgi:hypothetical protein